MKIHCSHPAIRPVWHLRMKKKKRHWLSPGFQQVPTDFQKDLAALIAVNETKRFLNKNSYPEKVIFVTYGDDNYEIYRKLLDK